MDFERYLDDVVLTLKKAKSDNIKVNLLIGAGCSATANIPTADGFVNIIKESFPHDYDRANPKDYANCMSKLTPFERRNLIMNVVNESKINWAHIAIAQLLKENYINRIITTNFDNVVQRACALVGEFPAIYDLTTSENFRTDLLFDKSVLHLHGQYTGFIQCNTGHEVEHQADILRPIFEQLSQQSLWIIVGYSGENDPIFQLLTEKELFEYRLFWIGYKDNLPTGQLKENLLSENRYAFYIRGYDADSFFVQLSQKLDCFPPTFIQKPFSYLSESLDSIATYNTPEVYFTKNIKQSLNFNSNIQLTTQNVIKKAIETIENDCVLMAEHFLLAGLVDEVIKLDNETNNEPELEEHIISAYLLKGGTENLIIAHERTLRLIDTGNNNANNHLLLATIFIRLFIEERNERKYINYANEEFKKSINEQPRWNTFFVWGNMIQLITSDFFLEDLRENDNNSNEFRVDEIILDYLENFEKAFQEVIVDLEESNKIISLHFVYSLIDDGFFDLAEKALVIFEKYHKILGPSTLPYLEADWGMWFFRNVQIDVEVAQEKGTAYYNEAFRLIVELNPYGKDNEIYLKAFKQKYFLEYAKFLLDRTKNQQEAIYYLQECISYGEIKVNKKTYEEAVYIIDELDLGSLVFGALEASASK